MTHGSKNLTCEGRCVQAKLRVVARQAQRPDGLARGPAMEFGGAGQTVDAPAWRRFAISSRDGLQPSRLCSKCGRKGALRISSRSKVSRALVILVCGLQPLVAVFPTRGDRVRSRSCRVHSVRSSPCLSLIPRGQPSCARCCCRRYVSRDFTRESMLLLLSNHLLGGCERNTGLLPRLTK